MDDSEPPELTLRRRATRFWLTSAARSAATSDSPTAAPSDASSVMALPPYMLQRQGSSVKVRHKRGSVRNNVAGGTTTLHDCQILLCDLELQR